MLLFFLLFRNKFIYSAKNKSCVLRVNRRYVSILCLPPRKESQNCPFCELVPRSQQDQCRAGSPAHPLTPLYNLLCRSLGLCNSRPASSLPCCCLAGGLEVASHFLSQFPHLQNKGIAPAKVHMKQELFSLPVSGRPSVGNPAWAP